MSQSFASHAHVHSVVSMYPSPRVRAEDYTQIIVNLLMSGTISKDDSENKAGIKAKI